MLSHLYTKNVVVLAGAEGGAESAGGLRQGSSGEIRRIRSRQAVPYFFGSFTLLSGLRF